MSDTYNAQEHFASGFASGNDPKLAWENLKQTWVDTVDCLYLPEVAVVKPDVELDLSPYRLIPFVSRARRLFHTNLEPLGYHSYILPEGIKATYKHKNYDGNDGRPYLDAYFSIGLLYGDWLVAASAAGVTAEGCLLNKQNQDVTSVRQGDIARESTGLDRGLRWPDTFMRCWEEVARVAGIGRVMVLGAVNHTTPEVKATRFHPNYDLAADRQCYERLPDKNWSKDITLQ